MSLWSVLLRELPDYLLLSHQPRYMLRGEANWQAEGNETVAHMLEAAPAHLHLGQTGAHALRAALFRSVALTATVVARRALIQWRTGQVFDLARREVPFFARHCHEPYVQRERAVETWGCMQDDFVFAWGELEACSDNLDYLAVSCLRGRFRGTPLCPLDYTGRL